MKKPLFFVTSLLFASHASAQLLPPPAPQPSQKPSRPAPEPPLLEDPLPSEAPIIIGEPVRRQNGVLAAPKTIVKPKASVAGVSIVGLSEGAAVEKLRISLLPELKKPLRLVIGDYQYTFLREELGASLPVWPLMRAARRANGNVPLKLEIDAKKLGVALQELDDQVRQDFARTGLNLGSSAARVKIALESAPIPASVVLETVRIEEAPEKPIEKVPTTGAKPVSGKFGFLLASFSTRYDASLRGRTTNLKMAAKNINGTVVGPGKVFSTNLAIGPRNASAGWREAKMFVSGRVVSGTGAGICQAASTLYNAALLSDLPIVERHAHSMRVMYVPPSRDAALMWGSKDFKFRNTTGGAIKVQTWVAGGKFHVNLWGQTPRESAPVQIVTRVLSRAGGTRSEAFKLIGGQKIRLSRDNYKPQP
ncbi:MAG TPA: VanW family protein [Abditibacterium sp.]|jgi:hypothetical protein